LAEREADRKEVKVEKKDAQLITATMAKARFGLTGPNGDLGLETHTLH
jgi:hypothetical protein